jgi:hypothetical protein
MRYKTVEIDGMNIYDSRARRDSVRSKRPQPPFGWGYFFFRDSPLLALASSFIFCS